MSLHDDLKAYLDGELPPERMAEMREALDRDPELAQEAELLGGISRTLRMAAAQPSAVGLEETLKALSRTERRPWWPWLAPIAVGAAALLFVVLPVRRSVQSDFSRDDTVAMRAESAVAEDSAAKGFLNDLSAEVPKQGASPRVKSSGVISSRSTDSSFQKEVRSGVSRPTGKSGIEGPKGRLGKGPGVPDRKPQVLAPLKRSPRSGGAADPDTPMAVRAPLGAAGSAQPVPASPNSDMKLAMPERDPEPLVIEVESTEEAEAAIRGLALRIGAEVTPVLAVKARADATSTIAEKSQDARLAERRIVMEIDEDRLEEARKLVPDAIREARLRAESQEASNRSLSGAAGGRGGGFGGGIGGGGTPPPGPTRQQGDAGGNAVQSRQGPVQNQNSGQQRQGTSSNQTQGPLQGRGGEQGTARYGNSQFDGANQKRVRGGTQFRRTDDKPRRRLEIILKIKPKPAGKLEE